MCVWSCLRPEKCSLLNTRSLLSTSMFSSGSSTSSSAVVVQSKHYNSNTAETYGSDNSSLIKTPKAKKCDMRWLCPKCQGDVRLPPPQMLASSGSILADANKTSIALNKNSVSTIQEEGPSVNKLHVMCALKCSAPRYHLACSAVPQGSQIFRFAIICCQPVADDADARGESSTLNYDTERMLENLYSSSGSAWWNLPADDSTCMMDGKRRSHQSLQNDKNWPTSMMSFVCPNCDVEGTSRYLLEYFERFHSLKKTFYEEYLSGSNNRGVSCRLDRADESVDARTGDAFLWYLMKDSRKEYLDKKQVKRPVTCSKLPPKNRVCIDPFFRSLDWNSSEIQLKNMGNVLTFLSKQQQKHQRRQKRQKSSFQLDPSYLVGMPIRLFNPIDNSYHTGRVLDFKLGAPHRIDQPIFSSNSSEASSTSPIPNIGELTDAKICSTLFLVRFRQGIEGRKISVHKWIYLEEHAVTVGGEICWANVGHQSGGAMDDRANKKVDDCKTKNGISPHVLKSDVKLHAQQYVSPYRPVQIIFRSLLEMIPVQNLNPYLSCEDITKSHTNIRGNDPCLNVLAMGFGLTFSHVRLSLKDCAGSERKTAIVAPLNDTSEESARAEVILLTPNNPSWIDQILHRAELSDEDVALELGMACMEKEEERRIRLWCNLSVSHIFKLPFNERNNAEEPV